MSKDLSTICKTGKEAIIIGGGAAGMTAAVFAARAGVKVTLLEAGDRVGKKLLRTGNGRCNLTNDGCRHPEGAYSGTDPCFADEVLRRFDIDETIKFWKDLGICLRDFNGWYYPFNEEAASVKAALTAELGRLKVKVKTGEVIRSVTKDEDGCFSAATDTWIYRAPALLIAAGSTASLPPETPDGVQLARQLGHTVLPFYPVLVSLCLRDRRTASKWAGVRARALARLFADGELIDEERGQIQFTAKGISGIAVMNLSLKAGRLLDSGKKVVVSLNFLDGTSTDRTAAPEEAYPEDPDYLLPAKLVPVVFADADGREEKMRRLSDFQIEISGTGLISEAQASGGGVLTAEIDANTMSSKLVPGLFFAGEMIDIAGKCGGYNLQFAWSSGALAGRGLASFLSIV